MLDLKICQILPAYYKNGEYGFEEISTRGGAERYVTSLALHLAKKSDVTLITFGQNDYELEHKGLKIKIIKATPFLSRMNGPVDFISLGLIRQIHKFDVIHAHQYYTDSTLISGLLGTILGKRVYITDLGWRGLTISRFTPNKYLCNKMLILTEYDKLRFRLKRNKYEVISGGVDLNKYTYNPKKKRKVIFIGRLLPHKGINYLLDALDEKTECVIAGHKLDDKYFRLLKMLARNKNVKFILSGSDSVIIKHLNESAVLVLPSVENDIYRTHHNTPELFGLVVAEAFATGTPVVVTDCAALPFVVDDNINGFIVEQNNGDKLKEKLYYLLNNKKTAENMGINARRKAERLFDWDKITDHCLKIYSE